MSALNDLIDALVEAGFSSTNARELAELLGGGGIGGATLVNGVAVVTIEGQQFGLLPVNAQGDVQANIVHRTGVLATLMALAGSAGEVGVATDTKSLVIFDGVPGQAVEIRPLGRVNSVGADSLTLGLNASTTAKAAKAVAVGHNAAAQNESEVVFGSGTPNVQTRRAAVTLRTVGTESESMTTDGGASRDGAANSINLARDGFYDIEFTVLAREIGTNNYARFVRRAVVRRSGSSTTQIAASETTPTPDIISGLTGADAYSLASAGIFSIIVQGVDLKTIQWAGYVTINELGISV